MEEIICPECGQTGFKCNASLAAHRKFKHKVDGLTTKRTQLDEVLSRLDEIENKINDKGVNMATDEDLDRMCAQFPGLCQKVDRIGDVLESHPVPNENLLQMWRQCPECQPKLERLIKSGAFKEKAEEAKSDDFPWVDHHIND